jgi:hypothetical protein
MSAAEPDIADLTAAAVAPFGTVGMPLGEGVHGSRD